jgi:hypothetical protein
MPTRIKVSIVVSLPLLQTRGGAARPGAINRPSMGVIPKWILRRGRMV